MAKSRRQPRSGPHRASTRPALGFIPLPAVLRKATGKDIALLTDHRLSMFADLGHPVGRDVAAQRKRIARWALPRLRTGELVGLIAEVEGGFPAASGCVWYREDQPRPWSNLKNVAYVMSIYTVKKFRGRGLASRIVRGLVADARAKGQTMIRLNASEMGMGVYERLGFRRTTEMRYWIDPQLRRWSARRR